MDGITITRADKTKALYPISPSNIQITKLNLADKKREEKLNKLKSK